MSCHSFSMSILIAAERCKEDRQTVAGGASLGAIVGGIAGGGKGAGLVRWRMRQAGQLSRPRAALESSLRDSCGNLIDRGLEI